MSLECRTYKEVDLNCYSNLRTINDVSQVAIKTKPVVATRVLAEDKEVARVVVRKKGRVASKARTGYITT